MELHFGTHSGNSARSLFAFFEAQVPVTLRCLDTQAKENRTPGYLAINPMGKIPALVDGDFHLWESNAINLYLAERHPEAKLMPTTARERAAVHRWLFFQSAHVSPACGQVFRNTNARMRAHWKFATDEAVLAAGTKELQRYLPVLEEALTGREFLEGAFSLADVALLPHLAFVIEGGFDTSPWPGVTAWLARLSARPAWRRALECIAAAPSTPSGAPAAP